MRIALLSAWASRLGGGVFESVVTHGQMLAAEGHEPLLFALEDRHSAEDAARFPGSVATFRIRGPRAIGFAPGLVGALHAARLDIVHLHGIWMYPSFAGARWAKRSGRPYLISPHGMLDPWIVSRGRAKKGLARIGYERRSWNAAALLHALTPAEAADIRRETGRDAVQVIPNAVQTMPPRPAGSRNRRIVALGRIHPKKNLDGLIAGWIASSAAAQGWELLIAGWGEANHVAQFEAVLHDAATPSIRFVGPTFGPAKVELLAGADFFILPSFSEGLPLAILEAWAAGVPTIQSSGCNLPEGFEYGAAIETGTDAAAIAGALDEAVAMPAERRDAMSRSATELADRRFSVAAIGRTWSAAYAQASEAVR